MVENNSRTIISTHTQETKLQPKKNLSKYNCKYRLELNDLHGFLSSLKTKEDRKNTLACMHCILAHFQITLFILYDVFWPRETNFR